MNKKKLFYIIIICVIAVAAASFVFYRINESLQLSQKKRNIIQNVKVVNPVRGEIYDRLLLSGDISAIQQANIYSRVTGNIKNIYADVGDYVSRGKVLAVIDKSPFQQSVKQYEALLRQYKATHENNKVNLERIKVLYEKGLAPSGDYDDALTKLKVSETQVEAAEANYENAVLQLNYCNITAPFSGYITKRLLDAGALVTASGVSSNSIFILSDISSLKIMVNIPEKNLSSVENISDVIVRTDAYPDETFNARFKQISQSFDLATRTMQAQVEINNSDRILKPGMFAKIEILLGKHENVLTLPNQCVLFDEKGNYVYTVNEENTARKVYVQTGYKSETVTEIVTGINDGDKVAFAGQDQINDNSKVQIIK
jgi:RND family efflux transporter MFP subunit